MKVWPLALCLSVTVFVLPATMGQAQTRGTCTWTTDIGPSRGTLQDVDVRTPHDAWAVGSTDGSSPLIRHWDGAAWSDVAVPREQAEDDLNAVDARTRGDAWAAGSRFRHGESLQTYRRWDGTRWRRIAPPRRAEGKVLDIAAIARSDAWAVGSRSASGGRPVIAAWHWDGTVWRRVRALHLHGWLTGIQLTRTGFLAVGYDGDGDTPLVLRWHDGTWHRMQIMGAEDVGLIEAAHIDGRWIVGETEDNAAVAVHREPAGWTVVPIPGLPEYTTLPGVAVVADDDVWVVGAHLTNPSDPETSPSVWTLLHWDGSAWAQETPPTDSGSAEGALTSAAVVPKTNAIVAVGWGYLATDGGWPHAAEIVGCS